MALARIKSFLLSRVRVSNKELQEVNDYTSQTDYFLFVEYILEKTIFRKAVREGKSISEVSFRGLAEQCELVAQAISDRIKEIKP